MAVICPGCGAEYDVTLFSFDRSIRCSCGAEVNLSVGHTVAAGARAVKGGPKMSLVIQSEAFRDGSPVPVKYTGDGEDVSPPLTWSGVPEGARELALICDDPDAPTPKPWVHWLLYKIPPGESGLPTGVPSSPRLERPAGALQGLNSWPSGQTIGYRGPAPPPGHGVHHYDFKLYALDVPLDLEPGADKQALLDAMSGHVLAEARLTGTYER